MSEVFIPLGGAGGKNRGNSFYISDTAPTAEVFGRIITPLPAGVYKKFVTPDGQVAFPSADGGNAVVSMSREFLKKQAIKTFGIASITNFSLTMYAHRQVRLTWAKPSTGLWSGVHFVFKYGSMPTNETDGFMFFDSADVHYETARLEERELFVRAYSYVTVTDGRWYDNGDVSAKINVTGISGSVTIGVGAGVWTVPDKVDKIRYILVGQGGAGDSNGNEEWRVGAGGGGGYFTTGYMAVRPGQQLSYIVPSYQEGLFRDLGGGNLVSTEKYSAYFKQKNIPGLDTVFSGIRAQHGTPGWSYVGISDWTYIHGGNGGSGGGGGNGGAGGRNGSDGGAGGTYPYGWRKKPTEGHAGIGSHQSTTGFNGVLYCTGGSGGTIGNVVAGAKGSDGLGNGGGGAGAGGKNTGRRMLDGGAGGTGCIYIAWGSAMNDGS